VQAIDPQLSIIDMVGTCHLVNPILGKQEDYKEERPFFGMRIGIHREIFAASANSLPGSSFFCKK